MSETLEIKFAVTGADPALMKNTKALERVADAMTQGAPGVYGNGERANRVMPQGMMGGFVGNALGGLIAGVRAVIPTINVSPSIQYLFIYSDAFRRFPKVQSVGIPELKGNGAGRVSSRMVLGGGTKWHKMAQDLEPFQQTRAAFLGFLGCYHAGVNAASVSIAS